MKNLNEISKTISNNKKIEQKDILRISKYISSLFELGIIKNENKINELIEKVCNQLEGIFYYDNNDEKLLAELGISKDNKGKSKDNVIYVNKNMSDEMIEITLFHELTHFLQRFNVEGLEECIGIMQNYKWRILMEAQTQNIAEMVYSNIYGKEREKIDYKSEELRMLPGGNIKSNLRNYQMYDYILKKICLVLEISIKDFIAMNFQGVESMNLFEKKLSGKYGDEVLNFIYELLDVIYSTDAIIYTGGEKELNNPYNVASLVDGRTINASSKNQFRCMKQLDLLLMYLSKDKIDIYSFLLDNQFDKNEEYLPQNEKFSEVSHASNEDVENNPEKYIMTECIPACKELWKKNIYTFMVSNYVGETGIWIEIYNEISDENKKYLDSLKLKNIKVDIYHEGCYRIRIDHIGKNASDLLLEVCKGFKMQDVPKNIACFTEEDFLIDCGCFSEIENPNYYEMKEFYEMDFESLEEQRDYIEKYSKWEHSDESKKYLKKYDSTKKIKSTEQYAKDNNMIYVDGVIYRSKYDFDKHIKYLQYINRIIEEQNYTTHFENGVESIIKL